MSVLLSDRLNKSFKEFEEEVILGYTDISNAVSCLKGAMITEIAIKNQEFRAEINQLKIAMNELKKINRGE